MDRWAAQRTAQQCLSIKYVENLAGARQTTQTSLRPSFSCSSVLPVRAASLPLHWKTCSRPASTKNLAHRPRRPYFVARACRCSCIMSHDLMYLGPGLLSSGTKDAYLRGRRRFRGGLTSLARKPQLPITGPSGTGFAVPDPWGTLQARFCTPLDYLVAHNQISWYNIAWPTRT